MHIQTIQGITNVTVYTIYTFQIVHNVKVMCFYNQWLIFLIFSSRSVVRPIFHPDKTSSWTIYYLANFEV